MADHDKISILLADEDALRRDGLAAVISGQAGFQIIAQCGDGECALDRIRVLRPQVAIVDLNLPKVHGIELVRRVRGEALGTRIVILSGTTDDDIIREVVRAGADGYLLKNGPARHLIDAISYVRDGGQYFSPQLRRDGLDRHLLEEPARVPPPRTTQETRGSDDADSGYLREAEGDDNPHADRETRRAAGNRSARPRRPARRMSDPRRFRERLREEADGDLEDRDYEILGLMADGIKPILDRLDDIEGRVIGMESGEVPVPKDVRTWLDLEMVDTFRPGRAGGELALGRTVQDLEARLPQLIEDAVTARFQQMAGKLQEEIEETHIRTLETFVKNIQVKLVQRVSALETDMAKQAEAVQQLREYSQRTEDNLGRLISGVDRLAQELPKRLAAPAPVESQSAPPPGESAAEPERKTARRKHKRAAWPKVVWASVGVLVIAVGATVAVKRMTAGSAAPHAAAAPAASSPDTAKPPDLPSNADTRTRLEAAQGYVDRKDYATAEDIYKQVLKSEPNNVDALKALASVLYREDKIEESAAILEKLPRN